MKKLLFTLVLTAVMFLAAFATGFFAIGRALAQPGPGHGDQQPEAGQPSGVDPHVASPTAPDAHGASHHHDPSKDFRFVGPPFGHSKYDVKGGPYGDGKMVDEHGNVIPGEEEPMSAPFIYMVLNFALLLFILMKYGGPAAKNAAASRHDQIKTALDEAAKLRKQAADKLAEYESRLKDADSEIKKLVEGMRADAEADKARILENASRQAALMKKDAEQRIAAEIEYARAQLTKEVTAASAKATEELLKKKMVPSDQQKRVTSFSAEIQSGREAR
jgi:F0F1-type ATP synthase membrane subunit b/b'